MIPAGRLHTARYPYLKAMVRSRRWMYMGCSGWRGVMNQQTLRIGDDWEFRQ